MSVTRVHFSLNEDPCTKASDDSSLAQFLYDLLGLVTVNVDSALVFRVCANINMWVCSRM